MIEENDRDVGGCVYKGAGRIRACLLKKNPLSTQHGIRAKEMAQQPRVCYSAKRSKFNSQYPHLVVCNHP